MPIFDLLSLIQYDQIDGMAVIIQIIAKVTVFFFYRSS